jgi:hypothetical protein
VRPIANCRLVPSSLRISGERLLDTYLREAPFGILGPGSDFAANNSSLDWYCRDAHERLALR